MGRLSSKGPISFPSVRSYGKCPGRVAEPPVDDLRSRGKMHGGNSAWEQTQNPMTGQVVPLSPLKCATTRFQVAFHSPAHQTDHSPAASIGITEETLSTKSHMTGLLLRARALADIPPRACITAVPLSRYIGTCQQSRVLSSVSYCEHYIYPRIWILVPASATRQTVAIALLIGAPMVRKHG